jgi:actin-like ATPase involved in cell morphogenesis
VFGVGFIIPAEYIFMKLFKRLSPQPIGIDAGSETIRITNDKEVILNEPSKISFTPDGKISGFGDSVATNHLTIAPIDFVSVDFIRFEQLLRSAVKQGLSSKSRFFTNLTNMYMSMPITSTPVEHRAHVDSGEHCGAANVYLIPQPYCAAVGLGILAEKKDFVLIDFGASKTEIAVFANATVIAQGSVRFGTWKLKQMVKNHLTNQQQTLSNQEIDQLIKLPSQKIEGKGIDQESLQEVYNLFIGILKDKILEVIELARQQHNLDTVLGNGAYFTGGGATIDWLVEQIRKTCHFNHQISQHPLLDVSNGLIKIINQHEVYQKYFINNPLKKS